MAAVRASERHRHHPRRYDLCGLFRVRRPDTGAHELPGIKKGIRISSARDGSVTAFIEDMESLAVEHADAEGVGVDADGNVYGGVVRRQMLERHVKK
jgi:hypothetical protein